MFIYLQTLEEELCTSSFSTLSVDNSVCGLPGMEKKLLSTDIPSLQLLLYKYSTHLTDIRYEGILIKLLDHSDKYIKYKSCSILTAIYKEYKPSTNYFRFIKNIIDIESYDEINLILNFIVDVLTNTKKYVEQSKVYLAKDTQFINNIISYMNIRELQYNSLLVVWILSYSKNCIFIIEDKIDIFINIIAQKYKEKILRVTYGILKNILYHNIFISISKSNKLIELSNNLISMDYKDKDFIEDIRAVCTELETILKNTSSVENYINEIFSGKLEEAPYHYSNAFWENNLQIIVENKNSIFKALKKYLKSDDIVDVCVAANDIYRIIKVAPDVYPVIEKLNIKHTLVKLSASHNENIRFHAIQTLATCIFSEWTN